MDNSIYKIRCEFNYDDDPLAEACNEIKKLRDEIYQLQRAYDKLLREGWMEWKKAGQPGDWRTHE